MYTIRMTAYPHRMENIINVYKGRIEDLQKKIRFAGEMSADFMKSYIVSNTKRKPSTGTLAESINVHELNTPSLYKVSVGRVDELPIYWYVINYGKKLDGTEFIPGGGKVTSGDFGGEKPDSHYRGVSGGGGIRMTHPGSSRVKASRAIEGMGFVEKTKNWLLTALPGLLS